MSWRKHRKVQKLQKLGAAKIDKNCNEGVVTISYKIKVIISTKFMVSS